MSDYIKECSFTIHGSPKSKSNHSLVNADGKKILPKNSPYALYEKEIVHSILDQVGEGKFKGKIICVLSVYFKEKNRHPDLNNMPKSICDGIEKSGIIKNDRDIVSVFLEENYDSNNPRVEVSLYDFMEFKPVFKVSKRTKADKNALIEEEESIQKKKAERKSKKAKGKVTCHICKCDTDVIHAKKIANSKDYICLKCLFKGM